MKLTIGDRITWTSAAGHLDGKIVNIVLSENGKGDTVPWIDVKTNRTTVRLCAIPDMLKALRVDNITDVMYN